MNWCVGPQHTGAGPEPRSLRLVMVVMLHPSSPRPRIRQSYRYMGLPCFDVVLGLSTGAVDVLVDRARLAAGQAGDDEARIGPSVTGLVALQPGLDTGDDALDAVPAACTVIELFEAPQLPAAGSVRPGQRAGFQRQDMLSHPCRRGQAQGVIQSLGPAEAEHLG